MTYLPFTSQEPTIASIVSGVGGAVTIIRISGTNSLQTAQKIWRGKKDLSNFIPRKMILGSCFDIENNLIDAEVLACYMPGPNSYTGEDVVELQCHGGSLVGQLILNNLFSNNDCQAAEPGEYTKRAFLNGRIDLTQAEAVANLITAQSQGALHLAGKQLKGYLGAEINVFYEQLIAILAEFESRLDFPDEDLDWIDNDHIEEIFNNAKTTINTLLKSKHDGEIYRNGLKLVIAGAPNVGKSSLMNAILGHDRAIVTHIAGTTRDIITESVQLRGIPICLTDTAGLRETDDIVEQSGIQRSHDSLQTASLILWLYDITGNNDEAFKELSKSNIPIIFVGNKVDLLEDNKPKTIIPEGFSSYPNILISAQNNIGMDKLIDAIEEFAWQGKQQHEPEYSINARHAALLETANEALEDAYLCAKREEYELSAITLRSAINDIGKISGKTADHDILDDIFSKFCIGK